MPDSWRPTPLGAQIAIARQTLAQLVEQAAAGSDIGEGPAVERIAAQELHLGSLTAQRDALARSKS